MTPTQEILGSVPDDLQERVWVKAAHAELERLESALKDIAYSGKTKTGMKESAIAALFGKKS